MRSRNLLFAVGTCLFALAMYAADNPMMGTWTLNKAKSKIAPGATINTTVVYSADGDNIKVTTDGSDAKGQATHTEWVGKFDGKEYPVTGADPGTTARLRSLKMARRAPSISK